MSRLDAVDQYNKAQSRGKKYFNTCKSRGQDPFLKALEEMMKISDLRSVPVGIIEIPMERIAGTYSESRKNVFAGNFMPLPDDHSEFAKKWVDLCEYHLDGSGIADPISCYEYLGDFYVREGNKRVSVLKSYDATEISGNVIRLLPPISDDPEVRLYYEFLDFYKVSRLYNVTFSRSGQYARLQDTLGYEPEQAWPEEVRWEFYNVFTRFSSVFERLNREKLEISPGDALLLYMDVHPYQELRDQTKEEIQARLNKLWPDLRLFAKGEPISLSISHEEKGKSIRSLFLGAPKIHAVFLYDMEPNESSWVFSHDTGRKNLIRQMDGEIDTETLVCDENGVGLVEKAIERGVNVIFATSHKHTGICRRIAADHPNIAVFNCTPNTPYAGVRGYYCRTYEGKFIAGAVAGVVAGSIAHQ
ncbi:MAG: BMP family ABC transporter substrate-binding protein, partial [Lentisphaeria bacterium]|nr:BMP family ABC transporter substrate-binding protein [Lentisphaeria bacterium]